MAVDDTQLKISPYTSTVPLVQVPVDQIDAGTRPAPPLQGQFGKKGTGPLAIGDAIVKGILQGHAYKEAKKNQQAQATIAAADAATEASYQKYQDALSQAGGKVDDPNAKAAYDAYLGVFNQSKQAKAQFVIPEKPQKGQKSQQKQGEKGEKKTGFSSIKDFFEANPHIVPQIALMSMQPKPQGLSRDARLANAQVTAAEAQAQASTEQAGAIKEERQRATEADQQQKQRNAVEAAGGIDSVLGDKGADPSLKQTARQMKFEALDKQSPEGKLKTQLLGDVQAGSYKQWTPEQRMLAGALGVVPQPQVQTITGKNGHQQQILVDPTTNQPVPGSKPLDLGPPQWAQEFYAKQAADRAEIHKAVESDPAAYGVQLGADPKANKAAIEARSAQLQIRAEFGIQSLSDMFGKTGYEVQRDNSILNDVVKAAGLNSKNSPLDSGSAQISYPVDTVGADGKTIPAGTSFAVGRDYFNKILTEFTATPGDNSGVRGFRATPENPDKKPPQVLEAERKFLYGWVKNQMLDQKGKSALTSAQADSVLKNTALGQPITSSMAARGGMEQPPAAPTRTGIDRSTGLPRSASGMDRPPSGPTKLYMVPGYSDPVELTDEEAQKAKAANIQLEAVDPSLIQ
jgi:hypothetical protein